jgi:hypothetical protein
VSTVAASRVVGCAGCDGAIPCTDPLTSNIAPHPFGQAIFLAMKRSGVETVTCKSNEDERRNRCRVQKTKEKKRVFSRRAAVAGARFANTREVTHLNANDDGAGRGGAGASTLGHSTRLPGCC